MSKHPNPFLIEPTASARKKLKDWALQLGGWSEVAELISEPHVVLREGKANNLLESLEVDLTPRKSHSLVWDGRSKFTLPVVDVVNQASSEVGSDIDRLSEKGLHARGLTSKKSFEFIRLQVTSTSLLSEKESLLGKYRISASPNHGQVRDQGQSQSHRIVIVSGDGPASVGYKAIALALEGNGMDVKLLEAVGVKVATGIVEYKKLARKDVPASTANVAGLPALISRYKGANPRKSFSQSVSNAFAQVRRKEKVTVYSDLEVASLDKKFITS